MNKIALLAFIACIALTSPVQARESLLDATEVTSPGGITAWLVEDHSIPVISLQFAFKNAGSQQDPSEMQGLAQLASNTMDEGAGDLDSQAFQKQLQDLSISLRFASGRDNFVGEVKTLTRNKNEAFNLLQLALTKPRFDDEAVDRMRASNQSRIKRSLSNPSWMAARISNDKVFEGHPYAQNSGGTLSSLDALTAEDLRNFVKTRLGRNNLSVAVAGDITKSELTAILDRVFGDLPNVTLPEVSATEIQNQGHTYLYERDIPQTVIDITHPGLARTDPDIFTAQIMNYILGGAGFGSRLMEEVREKRGLSYGIYTSLSHYDRTNAISLGTSTANKNVKDVLSIIDAEWQKMTAEKISEDDLKNAKSFMIGSTPLSLTSTDNITGLLLSLQLAGLPIDYLDKRREGIEKASSDDVLRISKKLLDPEKFVTILVGAPEEIEGAKIIKALPNVE